MQIEEITVANVLYRGLFHPQSPGRPWKITAFLPSNKRGTSGARVGASWQTWKTFPTEAEAVAAWQTLEANKALGDLEH